MVGKAGNLKSKSLLPGTKSGHVVFQDQVR